MCAAGAEVVAFERGSAEVCRATALPVASAGPDYVLDGQPIPTLSASASRDGAGRVHLSLCNLHPERPLPVACQFQGLAVGKASGRVLTADRITAHNTFEAPNVVEPRPLAGITLADSGLSLLLPARSVAVLEIERP